MAEITARPAYRITDLREDERPRNDSQSWALEC